MTHAHGMPWEHGRDEEEEKTSVYLLGNVRDARNNQTYGATLSSSVYKVVGIGFKVQEYRYPIFISTWPL